MSASFEGPLDEHDGEFEALPCDQCGSLTGLGLTRIDDRQYDQKLLCHNCVTVQRMERALRGRDVEPSTRSHRPLSRKSVVVHH